MDSNPTPRAIILDSINSLKYHKEQDKNICLKELTSETSLSKKQIEKERLKEKIISICKNQKQYIQRSLFFILEKNLDNALMICDYIIAEQNEINIKETTKEGKIKVLVIY